MKNKCAVMCYKVQIQVVDDSMANRWRIAHDSYVNHALLSYCYDESTLDSIHHFGCFLFMVTLDSIHDSNRRWIVWWVVRRLAITWLPAVDEPDSWSCWYGVSGCAGNVSRPRNKLRPRSPFSGKKNIGNRTYPGWMAWISALCTCAHTHACRKNRACAFLAGFRVVCCLFYRFPVRNALRASQAVLITGVMVNPADWQVQKKAL